MSFLRCPHRNAPAAATGSTRVPHRPLRRWRPRRGLSLVELMISLAITAMLLTAVAAAFAGTTEAMKHNDRFFRATQAARVSLNRILHELRTGDIDPPPLGGTIDSSRVTLMTAARPDGGGAMNITYRYDAASKQLLMVTNDDATDRDYVLAKNVTHASFVPEVGMDYQNTRCVAWVTVTIVVTEGNNSVRLSGSVAPRRALIY